MTGCTSQQFCSVFIELKICPVITDFRTLKVCGNQRYVLFLRQKTVHHSTVSTIGCEYGMGSIIRLLLDVVFEKLAVTIVILLVLIVNCNAVMIIICHFHDIGDITSVVRTCLLSIGGIRIRRILHDI